MNRKLKRISIKIYEDQLEKVQGKESFNLSGFVREKLDEKFTSSSP